MKKKISLLMLVILIIVSGYFLISYISFHSKYTTSNAIFVKSDSLTNLSFKLPGKIEKIYVKEGDNVKRGELLAKLDTKDLEIKKKKLEYEINSLSKKILVLKIQKEKLYIDIKKNLEINKLTISKLQDSIKAKAFEIDALNYKLNKLKNDYKKFKRLYKNNKISKDKFESVKVAYFSLKDNINSQKKILDSLKKDKLILMKKNELILNSKKDLENLEKEISSLNQKLLAMKENLKLLNQNIKDSFLYAPFDSEIAKKFANDKEIVRASQRVLSLVNLNDLYVLDLLEETKLKRIKKGCKAIIHIDALDKNFEGEVEKILPASAATFALLPRDISSGEFTKLAQRFFVKIKFKTIPKDVLVGMSGEATINKCKVESVK